MDVIYPYLRNYSRELQWSIKSLDNIEHGKVIVAGDDPLYPIGATIRRTQEPYWASFNPYANVIFKVIDAIESIVSEDFLLMNDDFFIMKPQEIVNYYRGTLDDHIAARSGNDSYSQALKNTKQWLESKGYPTKSFEAHTPMLMNAKRFQEMFEAIGREVRGGSTLLMRSIYGNMFNIEAVLIDEDPKTPTDVRGKALLSTTEQSFLSGAGRYIRNSLRFGTELEPRHTVSVVIPAYNAANTIQKCLASIPNHPQIKEIIVIDDFSSDDTAEIIKNYPDERIKSYGHDRNRGVGYTFNELVEMATGEYILRIDSDDFFTDEISDVIERINGEDIIYFNMVDNDGSVRRLNFNTRMITVACCHIFRRDFIKGIKTIETNWGEDRYLMKRAIQMAPRELYTNLNAYRYNYPRAGSLTDMKKKRDRGHTKDRSIMLAIMSNCTNDVLERPTIFETYRSYVDTFGEPEAVNIYIDPNPNPQFYREYLNLLMIFFVNKNVKFIETTSLSNGYREALNTEHDYIFFVEHDWIFQNVSHNLNQIVNTMQDDDLWFMLFNQHRNVDNPRLAQWQSYLRPKSKMYCESDRISNNPHIIHRETYKELAMPLVDWTVKGAGLIEQVLEKKFNVAIYGAYDLPPTIVHIDGRRNGLK